jgi:2,3,4,5-tetrahydropyridine-2-carboxylate N-succinyltransferase
MSERYLQRVVSSYEQRAQLAQQHVRLSMMRSRSPRCWTPARCASPNPCGRLGAERVAEEAVLLAFRTRDNGDPHLHQSYDKPPGTRTREAQRAGGTRIVPHAIVRHGDRRAGRGADASYVNIGAYVGAGTMVDTCDVGSCAQIGRNVPLPAVRHRRRARAAAGRPDHHRDGFFIGARSRSSRA